MCGLTGFRAGVLGCGVLWLVIGVSGAEFDQTHATFSRVLQESVREARVDYGRLKATPELLDSYLEEVSAIPPTGFREWSRENRLALLLNLYNAATLRLVTRHYPVTSIRKIGLLPGAAWKERFIRFGGEVLSLDQLEHERIRREYREPRIHFALVCAALSCPPLREEPYTGVRLDDQLTDQGRRFLGDTRKNRLVVEAGTLRLSRIFDWYRGDFEAGGRTLLEYVKPFLPEATRASLSGLDGVRVEFNAYDWALNDATGTAPR